MARLFFALSALFALAQPAAAQSFNAEEQAEIRAVVRDYLVRNPDVLEEALEALQARTDAARRVKIERDTRDFSIGPANAPIVIVEFFDYRCPYCHSAMEWVAEVARTRRDVRIVLKEFPILGPESLEASRAAVAAMPQGRYWAFHQALMSFRGDLTSARIDQLARQSGVDVARMRRRMNDAEITTHLQDNQGLGVDSNISGTPGFMINGELTSGFRREDLDARLREATASVRAQRAAR
jgi:protein-disulfide isomerase